MKILFISVGLTMGCFSHLFSAENQTMELHGVAWTQLGRIEKSSDTVSNGTTNNFNDNWTENTGAMLVSGLKLDDNWNAHMGVGVVQAHLSRGSIGVAANWYPFWVPFVSEANIDYLHPMEKAGNSLRLNFGFFPYNYNPDIKNLGLYLLRGYVYPGTVVSAFESKPVIPAASVFGAKASVQLGDFRNDIIINSEFEERPLYDFSMADVVNYNVMKGIEIGAGVNFYRVITQDSKVTAPTKSCNEGVDLGAYSQGNPKCYIIDTSKTPDDTIVGSLAGTKLMARFRIDPKEIFGIKGAFEKDDMVLYSEAAILGLKNYPIYYDNILRRIPVVVGFNFPVMGYLDNLSLEVEYYASKNYPDNGTAYAGSWVPRDVNGVNNGRDDWKWSIYASKVLVNHVKFSGQIADDHFRPGGSHDRSTGAEALSTPTDWYWMAKLAFFF